MNVTPMLDVVFILLIFFIVTATVIRESGIDVTRPDQTPVDPAPAILVQISGQDEVFVERRVVDQRAVRANIERLRAENPDATVVVQTDDDATTGVLVSVVDQAALAGASVSIAPMDKIRL